MENKKFDLNIGQVLEDWEVEHAVREIIANALDETLLSRCQGIDISKDTSGRWIISDYGRGLQIEHFTVTENAEKLVAKTGVIGKFGFGLKDAVATLHRRGIAFFVESRYGRFQIEESDKVGFDIRTLHIDFTPGPLQLKGTRFVFENLADEIVEKAKSLFLRYSKLQRLENAKWGDMILARGEKGGEIFINGLKVSEEPDFMFSYSIAKLTQAMRKHLDRERTNVGRAVYLSRIKTMLRGAEKEAVLSKLVEQVENEDRSDLFDEMKWIEVKQKALAELSKRKPVVFITEDQALEQRDMVDHASRDGNIIRIITEQEKINLADADDRDPRTILLDDFSRTWSESFNYNFVDVGSLKPREREIFGCLNEIIASVGLPLKSCPKVRISETMRQEQDMTSGAWDKSIRAIVIKRTELRSLEAFAGTLLHEIIHATTGLPDVNRDFETVLSDYLGKASASAIKATRSRKQT